MSKEPCSWDGVDRVVSCVDVEDAPACIRGGTEEVYITSRVDRRDALDSVDVTDRVDCNLRVIGDQKHGTQQGEAIQFQMRL